MNKIQQILIVDDDPNLRKTLSDILKIKGYAVAAAADGATAIAYAQQTPVNVALIDLVAGHVWARRDGADQGRHS